MAIWFITNNSVRCRLFEIYRLAHTSHTPGRSIHACTMEKRTPVPVIDPTLSGRCRLNLHVVRHRFDGNSWTSIMDCDNRSAGKHNDFFSIVPSRRRSVRVHSASTAVVWNGSLLTRFVMYCVVKKQKSLPQKTQFSKRPTIPAKRGGFDSRPADPDRLALYNNVIGITRVPPPSRPINCAFTGPVAVGWRPAEGTLRD